MARARYKPHQDASGYPGADLSAERAERLRNLDLDPDEITVDDIVHNVSKNGSSIFFMLLRMVAEDAGEETARDYARRIGYIVGRSNYRKMQRRFGVTTLGPERLARYEDTVHLLGGVDMAHCFSDYDEDTCVITRTRCPFHTGHPPGAGHYCQYLNEGFAKAYEECDPNLIEMAYPKSMARGDDHCEHIFRFRPGSGAPPTGGGTVPPDEA
jgi:hypothetical protein